MHRSTVTLPCVSPSRQRGHLAIAAAAASLPLLVLVVALAQRTWYPTGDLAQAELRMLAMPGEPPLLGAAGRIADEAGRQGNHPGPLMFWVTWPLYELLGGSSWAFSAATAIVNLIWLTVSIWLVSRFARPWVTGWYVAVALTMAGGFGLDALSQPWNPWVALFPFAVLVLTAVNALGGWRWAPVLGVAAASYAIQGHVGYAPVVLPVLAVAVAGPLWHRWRTGQGMSDGSTPSVVPILAAVGVGLVAWCGPLLDVIRNDPHNLDLLVANFSAPSEDPIGLGAGLRAVLQAAHPFGAWVWGGSEIEGSVLPGLALLLTWAAVAATVALRGVCRPLDRINVVLTVVLLAGVVAVSRVFGEVYLYVFRWVVVVVALVVFALGWGVASLLPRPLSKVLDGRGAAVVGLTMILILALVTSVRVVSQEIPYESSWRMEQRLAPAVAEGLDPEKRYLVEWEDRVYLGGLAFGLMLDLERRGFDVGGPPSAVAGIGRHRVRCDDDYDAVVTVVTGSLAIETWSRLAGAELLAETGPADPDFDAETTFAELRDALARAGRNWDPIQVEEAMTMLVLTDDLGPEVNRLASDLVAAGVPTAVFVQDPAPDRPPLEATPRTEACF